MEPRIEHDAIADATFARLWLRAVNEHSKLLLMDEPSFYTWTVALAVVSAVVAIAAVVIAGLAKRDSAEASKAAKRSADAAELSAAASVDSAAEARRGNDRNDAADREVLNERIRVALKLEEDTGRRFRFVNKGDRPIKKVRIVDPPKSLVQVPKYFDVQPRGKSGHFILGGGKETERPQFLMVKWAGMVDPVPVNFPYDPELSVG